MSRQFLSLGGGVQSTALFLMSLHGEIENPVEAAIFADTGWERQATYDNVAWLTEYAAERGVPVHVVSNGNIREYSLTAGSGRISVAIPFFIRNKQGDKGMLRRQCTSKFKVRPINKLLREMGATAKSPVIQWIGISVDEVHRMKPSQVKYVQHRFPLVDKRLGRDSCYQWLVDNDFKIPARSSCVGCP